jgi:flagellar basal body-associated protein FliL
MAIPYENMEQRRDLRRKMKKIKDDFLTTIEQSKMEEWVKQRDFAAIRNEYLKIINQHTDKPIENLYFESFNIY